MRFSTGAIPDSSSHPAKSHGRRSCLVWVFTALLFPFVARAEHFDIKLVATGPNGTTQQAFADQTPPIGGLNPRPVLRVRAGDAIAIQFVMTDVYAHGDAPDAGVRFYVVRERSARKVCLRLKI